MRGEEPDQFRNRRRKEDPQVYTLGPFLLTGAILIYLPVKSRNVVLGGRETGPPGR